MQMVGVSTVVSSLLSMFRVRCFGSIASAFRKYSESRKYYEMFGIITQIQTIQNLGTIPNFRNHCGIFRTIPHEISECFYTWRAIFRKRSTWCPDRNRDLVLETYVSMLERKIFSNDLRVRYHKNLS